MVFWMFFHSPSPTFSVSFQVGARAMSSPEFASLGPGPRVHFYWDDEGTGKKLGQKEIPCIWVSHCYVMRYVIICIFVTFLGTWTARVFHPGFLNDMSCNPLKKQDKFPRTSLLTSLNLGAISHGLLLIQRWAKTRRFPLPPFFAMQVLYYPHSLEL